MLNRVAQSHNFIRDTFNVNAPICRRDSFCHPRTELLSLGAKLRSEAVTLVLAKGWFVSQKFKTCLTGANHFQPFSVTVADARTRQSAPDPIPAVRNLVNQCWKVTVGYRPVADIPSSSQMSEHGISRDQERNRKAVGASEHRKLAPPSDSGWLSAVRDVLGAGHGKLFADARCLGSPAFSQASDED